MRLEPVPPRFGGGGGGAEIYSRLCKKVEELSILFPIYACIDTSQYSIARRCYEIKIIDFLKDNPL